MLFAQIKAGSFDFPSPYWDDVSDDAKDLILKLLVVDPTHRLSAAQVQTHKWVAPVRCVRLSLRFWFPLDTAMLDGF